MKFIFTSFMILSVLHLKYIIREYSSYLFKFGSLSICIETIYIDKIVKNICISSILIE